MHHAPHDRRIVGELNSSACSDRVIATREDAGSALRDLFLANADCGDNAANEQLVDALVRRMRTLRASGDGGR
ncbi:MAG: hypothetical protein ACRDSG_16375 [Pseudonocardiaceae bacterium]